MENNNEIRQPKPSLFGMITSPKVQFQRIKNHPKIWVPLLIITVLFTIGLAIGTINADFSTQVEGVSPDQVEVAKTFQVVGAIIGGLLAPIFMVLISTAIYMLIVKMLGSDVTFRQLFSMNTYLSIIGFLSLLINGIINIFVGGAPGSVYTSLAGLGDVEGALGGLLGSIEVFGIWQSIITVFGLHIVANLSKKASWTIVIIFFIIGVAFSMAVGSFTANLGV